MGIEALLLSQVITISGSTGQVVTRQADGTLALEDAAGGTIGGSTGATDNAILRADGTGGATLQNSGVTISDNAEVLIVSGATSAVPLRVRAAASQTAALLETQNSAGTRRFWVDPIAGSHGTDVRLRHGTLAAYIGWDATDWVVHSGGSGTLFYHQLVFGTGLVSRLRTDGTITLRSLTTDSGFNDTLYVKNGALFFRGGSGTITEIASA